jgi:hypothetical protein
MTDMFARSILFALGLLVLFMALVGGFHRAVEEVGGKALADHTLDFCPNWAIGIATGACSVGLLWWFRESWRK